MGLENNKWRVVKGDCLWNIAQSVYGNGYKWVDIANANGIPQSNPIIYPGQLFVLPGISTGGGGGSSTPPPPPTNKARIDWFALQAGSEREMQAVWSYNATHFWIRWQQWDNNGHLWMISENRNIEFNNEQKAAIATLKDTEGWNVCRFSVRPLDKNGNIIPNTDWIYKEYDFRNNPPKLPPNPEMNIDLFNKLTVTLNNIDPKINADSIEIAIYQNDVTKYKSVKVPINLESRFATYSCDVDPGYEYKVRVRAVRGKVYGGWTDFTSNDQSVTVPPKEITTLIPQIISEQMSKTYGVFAEWEEVKTAKYYQIQWTTNIEYFDDPDRVSSKTTEEGKGPRILISDLDIGHEYFFRVRSINDKGASIEWSAIKSIIIGTKPSAPTTWSNTSSAIMGEDLNLYWMHNSTDGSIETYSRLYLKIIDSTDPSAEPIEYTKVIPNTKPEEEKNQPNVYTINTNNPEWAILQSGFIIKWKVQTAGVASEYSEWSMEREVNMYAKPELELEIRNQNGETVSEINNFPFYIATLASPPAQKPISYYIEIIANSGYEIVDEVGNIKVVNAGDKIYQNYYDPQDNPWILVAEMNPGNVDLKNNIEYTVRCTVSMDSGLTTETNQTFNVYFNEIFYDVSANVEINKTTLEATIQPYCNEYYIENNVIKHRRTPNCTISVYRREYNGKFTEIATKINNELNMYITDPHPSLDYARYRIVAKSNDTGALNYADVPGVKVGEPSIVIQWAEKWTNFEVDDSDEGTVEPPWAGSMIKIPYNVDISETNNMDVAFVEYAGRQHPVSYYGTQLGETATWNVDIPRYDKETLYGIRRLSVWTDNVYVREPSGTGYWANVAVSYDIKHKEVIIPITFNITRVEGGI